MTNARSRASMRYDAENTVQIIMRLNKRTDADILEYFDYLKELNASRQGFIKEAILKAADPIGSASIWMSNGALDICKEIPAVKLRAMASRGESPAGTRMSFEPWSNELHIVTESTQTIHRYIWAGKWEYDFSQEDEMTEEDIID